MGLGRLQLLYYAIEEASSHSERQGPDRRQKKRNRAFHRFIFLILMEEYVCLRHEEAVAIF